MKGVDLILGSLEGKDVSAVLNQALVEHILTGKSLDEILELTGKNNGRFSAPRKVALLRRRGHLILCAFHAVQKEHGLNDLQTCKKLFEIIQSESPPAELDLLVSEINFIASTLGIKLSSHIALYNCINDLRTKL